MRITVLKKSVSIERAAAEHGLEVQTLAGLNCLERPGRLCRGMSLVTGEKARGGLRPVEVLLRSEAWSEASDPAVLETADYIAIGAGISPGSSINYALPERKIPDTDALILLRLSNTGPEGRADVSAAHEILKNRESQNCFTDSLCAGLEKAGWDGLILDMEYLFPFDKDAYSSFVSKAAERLHEAGLYLFCTLPAAAGQGLSRSGSETFDLAALSKVSDRIIIKMPGLAGTAAVKNAFEKAAEICPAGKIIAEPSPLGKLQRRGETDWRRMSPHGAQNLALSAAAAIRRGSGGPAVFDYIDPSGQQCRVEYADALYGAELLKTLELLGAAGLSVPYPGLCTAWETLLSAPAAQWRY